MPDERLPHIEIPAGRVRRERKPALRFPRPYYTRSRSHRRTLRNQFLELETRAAPQGFEEDPDAFFIIRSVYDFPTAELQRVLGLRIHRIHMEYRPDPNAPDTDDVDQDEPPTEQKVVQHFTGFVSLPASHKASFLAFLNEELQPGAALDKVTSFEPIMPDHRLDPSLKSLPQDQARPAHLEFFRGLGRTRYERLVDQMRTILGDRLRAFEVSDTDLEIFADITAEEAARLAAGIASLSSIGREGLATLEDVNAEAEDTPQLEPPRALAVDAGDVCILDSGISADNPFFTVARGVERDYTGTGVADENGHGSSVAGLATYAHAFWQGNVPEALNRIHSAKITNDIISARELHTRLREAILAFRNHARVFNLSINLDNELVSPGYTRHYLTETLDNLAREHDLVIVNSIGNIKSRRLIELERRGYVYPDYYSNPDRTETRILVPADGVNVLSVGSVALVPTDATCLAPYGRPSPHTRHAHEARPPYSKPDVVEEGGNLKRDLSPDPSREPWSLSHVGNPWIRPTGPGTSFSAPLIAALAGRIRARFPAATSNLVRALIMHACQSPTGLPLTPQERALLGCGHPDWERAFVSTGSRVTYYYEGVTGMNDVQFVPFHLPGAIVSHTGHRVIRATLAYDPPVDRMEATRYALARLQPVLVAPEGITTKPDGAHNWNSNWQCVKQATWRFGPRVRNLRAYGEGDWAIKITPTLNLRSPRADKSHTQRFAIVLTVEAEGAAENLNAYREIVEAWTPVRARVGGRSGAR